MTPRRQAYRRRDPDDVVMDADFDGASLDPALRPLIQALARLAAKRQREAESERAI